eukprot:9316690-Pyramimonas_sp.AAC.1
MLGARFGSYHERGLLDRENALLKRVDVCGEVLGEASRPQLGDCLLRECGRLGLQLEVGRHRPRVRLRLAVPSGRAHLLDPRLANEKSKTSLGNVVSERR